MLRKHTVEKIGGTSMSRFGEVMDSVIIGNRKGAELYNRIFVLSAYGGITNLLLEDKKNGKPGVFAKYAVGDPTWKNALELVRSKMLEYNKSFENIGLDQNKASEFVHERIKGVMNCLKDLMRVRSFGHLSNDDILPQCREFLSSIGEAHSAYNSTLILQTHGVNAQFVDLTCWKETEIYSLEEVIHRALDKIDLTTTLPIVTGYVKCNLGLMTYFDRGYSEITFSKTAVITKAREGIIHKEYHLSTGDPALMGVNAVEIIGHTNFNIADQMSDMDMEAIHSKASKEMEMNDIPIRIKNAFDPEHLGTLIDSTYVSPLPRVEMICGRNDIIAVEVYDSEMVGETGYDFTLLKAFVESKISYIAKNTNANTITHFVPEKSSKLLECLNRIKNELTNAKITTKKVAIVSVLGTNMRIPGFLARAANALAREDINILGLDQCMPQVNMQFIISREQFEKAQIALHKEFVKNDK